MRERIGAARPNAATALLIECARMRLDPARVPKVRDLALAVDDWPAVLELSRRHRLMALLHTHLTAVADDIAPEAARAALRAQVTENAARNLALARELLAVTQLLESRQIRVLPYKGVTLSQCIYGSLAVRQMKDMDILLRPEDLDRSVSLLASRGYEPVTRISPVVVWLGLEYQCVLTRPTDGAIIELHWSIVPRTMAPAMGLDDLWQSRLSTTILGQTVPSPSHEDMLVILCLHGAKHHWARLEWVCGVAELLRSKPLDWLKVLARAHRWRATRMLNTGLLLAADLLEAPVPDVVLSVAREDPEAVALVDTVLQCLFADDGNVPAARAVRAFQYRVHERMRDKARYLWFRPLIDGARTGARASARLTHWLKQLGEA